MLYMTTNRLVELLSVLYVLVLNKLNNRFDWQLYSFLELERQFPFLERQFVFVVMHTSFHLAFMATKHSDSVWS